MTRAERSWIAYDWANSAYVLIVWTVLLPAFFKDGVAVGMPKDDSTAWWSYANSLAGVLIAVAAPLLGTVADYPGRKKRLFAVFWLTGVAATFALCAVQPGWWLTCLAIFVVSAVAFFASELCYNALLVDVTTPDRLDRISSCGYAFGYIGSAIPYVACLGLVRWHGAVGLTAAAAVKVSFCVAGLWWLVFTLPMLRNVHQTHAVEPTPRPVADSFRRLGQTFRRIRGYRNVFVFLGAYFLYIDGVHTIFVMATPIGKDLGLSTDTLMLAILVVQIVGFPCAIAFGRLADRFGAKAMLMVGIIIYALVALFAVFMTSAAHFWVLAVMVGLAQGGVQALSRSLYARLIPPDQAAEFFGFYNVFGKFAAILGPLVVGALTQVTGSFRYGVPSLVVFFVVGGLLLWQVRTRQGATE